MAAVYAATHRNGNRVAIKILHAHVAKDDEARDRFLREGYAANRVGHPGAVTTLDDDRDDVGGVFLVMELLEGETLEARLRRGPLGAGEVLRVADAVLDVLHHAHRNGIIHRDIKPANVFLTREGVVKILDFGFARLREHTFDAAATRDGVVIGTPSFMPPEQAQAKPDQIDHRSDLWAVGATAFTALTGRQVHEGRTMVERLMAAMRKPAPSLAAFLPSAPAALVAWVDRALEFDKEARWADAETMRAAGRDVSRALLGAEAVAPPSSPAAAPWLTEPSAKEPSIAFELVPKERRTVPGALETDDTQLDPEAGDAAADLVTASMIEDVEDAGSSLLRDVDDVSASMIQSMDDVTASMIEDVDDEGADTTDAGDGDSGATTPRK